MLAVRSAAWRDPSRSVVQTPRSSRDSPRASPTTTDGRRLRQSASPVGLFTLFPFAPRAAFSRVAKNARARAWLFLEKRLSGPPGLCGPSRLALAPVPRRLSPFTVAARMAGAELLSHGVHGGSSWIISHESNHLTRHNASAIRSTTATGSALASLSVEGNR